MAGLLEAQVFLLSRSRTSADSIDLRKTDIQCRRLPPTSDAPIQVASCIPSSDLHYNKSLEFSKELLPLWVATMYCGDETGSFIGEIGSHTCRFGYGGEDNPKLSLPSYVSNKTHMASSAVSARVANQELESILRRPDFSGDEPQVDPNAFLRQGDLVENWDHLQTAWNTGMDLLRAKDTLKHTKGGTPYTLSNKPNKDREGNTEGKCVHPLLAITPGFTQFEGHGPSHCAAIRRKQYTEYTELMMESMEATSLFLAPSPMLAAFSLGRQTALVVDIGAGGTRVTPVVDGLLLSQAQRRNGRGGDWLGHVTWKALLEEKIAPKPRYLLRDAKAKAKSSLFHTWAMQELMYELRTQEFVRLNMYGAHHSRVPFSEDTSMDIDGSLPATPVTPGTLNDSLTTYEMPDGTTIDLKETTLGRDMTQIPELLFSKSLPFMDSKESSSSTNQLQTLQDAPLHELIQQSLLAVGDVDVRKELCSNILLTGGSSLFPNLDARLSHEVSQTLPGFVKPKVIAPRFSVERSCASWIGASILTSLGSFQQLWLSRDEYEEYGSTLAIQRFP